MRTLAIIACLALASCADINVKGFTFGVTDPGTGVTIGGTYSSKGGLTGSLTVDPTK